MRRAILFLPLLLVSILLTAQNGKISGKVISTLSGQPLTNATVTLIEKSRTVAADQNGNFSFNNLADGTYSVKCSNVSFDEKIIDEIIVRNGEAAAVTVSLDEKNATDKEVVITTKKVSAARETVASLLIAQKNSASVSDGISAESIKKTPDRSTGDVIKRVSGASIQDDRFAIIRGLNDRYNAAFINGAPLPSTESDRKAFAFDIFPSAILDNLIIYKTATPDKSGEFAGGIIDITTKSVQATNFTSISIGGSYNSLSTGKNRSYSETKGGKDWLGLDDGIRALPDGIPGSQALKNLNPAERADLAKLFTKYKWGIRQGNTSPNFNFQITRGLNIQRKEKEFVGMLFSINYNRNFTFTEGERNSFDYDLTAPLDQQVIQRAKYRDSSHNDEVILSGLANFSFKLNNRNSFYFKNNLSINTDNRIIKRFGPPAFTAEPDFVLRETVRWFTSNQIYTSQLSGEHTIGVHKTKINWLGSLSKVKREIPNLSRTSYAGNLPDLFGNFSNIPNQTAGSGTMFFADNDESIKSIKVDVTQPYTFMKNSQNFIKVGGGFQKRERDFTSRVLGFSSYNSDTVQFDYGLFQLPENEVFLPQNLGLMKSGRGGFLLNDGTTPNSDYSAFSELTHAYLMNDQRFFKKFRLIYGVRMEKFRQNLNSIKNLRDTIKLDSTVTDFLPSINFVYALTPKMNLRLSYSKTLNRPEFRELAPFLFFDYATSFTIEGQDILQRAKVTNYDFRYEFFPGKAQMFSISAFYKDFINPIEIQTIPFTSSQSVYVNSKSAKVYGIEAEIRTLLSTLVGIKREGSLLSKFTLSANAAFIKSEVILGSLFSFTAEQTVTDRALQGQSPYLLNGSLGYNDEKIGFSSTVSVNRVGDRIAIAGPYNLPNIYEKARTVVDFQISKSFLKNKMEAKFTARDLLSQNLVFYYDNNQSKNYSPDVDKIFSSNIAPKVFSLSVTYKF